MKICNDDISRSSIANCFSKTVKYLLIGTILISSVALNNNVVKADTTSTSIGVTYDAHVQNIGWQSYVSNGAEAGTDGLGLRVEALKIQLTGTLPAGASIQYQGHVQNIGWQTVMADGQEVGTDGQGLRVEAIKIALKNMPGYTVQYRAHVQNIGWQSWVSDGNEAGTDGQGLRIEAIEIQVVKTANGSTPTPVPFISVGGNGTPASSTSTTPSSNRTGTEQQQSVKALYGDHIYGCKTQAEYDAVMAKVKAAVATMSGMQLDSYVTAYINGDRASNYAVGSVMYKNLTAVAKNEGYFITHVSSTDAVKLFRAGGLFGAFDTQATPTGDSSTTSAYDILFYNVTGCESQSELQCAIWDTLGYSSIIIANNAHADGLVKVNNQWYDAGYTLESPNNLPVGAYQLIDATY